MEAMSSQQSFAGGTIQAIGRALRIVPFSVDAEVQLGSRSDMSQFFGIVAQDTALSIKVSTSSSAASTLFSLPLSGSASFEMPLAARDQFVLRSSTNTNTQLLATASGTR